MTCKQCRYFDPEFHECRADPPRYVETTLSPRRAVFASTLPEAWCGRWIEAEVKQVEPKVEEKRGPGRPSKRG